MESITSMYVKSNFTKKMFLIVMLLGISLFTFAQSKVTGTVVDTSGQPIIGASVLVKGAKTGVITDLNGQFTITPPTKIPHLSSRAWAMSLKMSVPTNLR